ncbi:MAG: hypothetical protein RJA76_1469 [Bacteroidota bacterium]|jgi:hypothetical protein
MYKLIVLFFLGFMLYSCQKKPQVVLLKKEDKSLLREPEYLKRIRLELQDLKSNEIQEKLTLEDEILLIATISVFERGKLVESFNRTSFLQGIKKGNVISLDSIKLPEVLVKKNQTLGVQISIWEVDDYTSLNKAIGQINQIGGLVQVPITLLEWSSVSNPVGWFLWGSRVGGLGLQWLAKKDKNDIIGVSEVQWPEKEMPVYDFVRSKKEVFEKKGKSLTNFNYILRYQIHSKEMIR